MKITDALVDHSDSLALGQAKKAGKSTLFYGIPLPAEIAAGFVCGFAAGCIAAMRETAPFFPTDSACIVMAIPWGLLPQPCKPFGFLAGGVPFWHGRKTDAQDPDRAGNDHGWNRFHRGPRHFRRFLLVLFGNLSF
jgi:hypothetical protein